MKEVRPLDRTIFLVDMNAFYISCEMGRNASLRGKPAAVAGDPLKRTGIILASNYEARAKGVKTAMTVHEALKRCPELLTVPPDHTYYEEVSSSFMNLLEDFTPLIEQNSIDEAWLDMTGSLHLYNSAEDAARIIMERLENELNLWCSIGISSNKFLSKMASDMKKPQGITSLYPSDVKNKLWPLPVGAMYGIGHKTSEALKALNILSIKVLAAYPLEDLLRRFGKHGYKMHLHAQGTDAEPLVPRKRENLKSIGKSITLHENYEDLAPTLLLLQKLSDEVSIRARSLSKRGHTVQITLKSTDFRVFTRQCKLPQTNVATKLYEAAASLLRDVFEEAKPIRLLGVSLTDFQESTTQEQLTMFSMDPSLETSPKESDKEEHLQAAIDLIRKKFGKNSVSFASIMKDKEKEP